MFFRLKKFGIKKIAAIFVGFLLVKLLIFFLVLALIQKKPKPLNIERVALIDVVGKNYLFRGNNPFLDKDHPYFAYDELRKGFNMILKQKGLKQLDDYYLIDVSLLDLDEYHEIALEENFFSSHHDYGSIISRSTLSPGLLFAGTDKNFLTEFFTKRYNQQITDLLHQLREKLSQQTDKKVVIYIHCNSGRDRVGFMIASYRLLFKNMNLREVNSQNEVEVGRNSEGFYKDAISSYCEYVRQNYDKPDDYCL